jgi:hypothetical protein
MQRVFLVVSKLEADPEGAYSVGLAENVELLNYTDSIRTSPLFSFDKKGGWIPNPDQSYQVAFFSVTDPVTALALIPPAQRTKTWFTLGLASIVVISDSATDADVVKEGIEGLLHADESWTILMSRLPSNNISYRTYNHPTFDPEPLLLAASPILPSDISLIVEELNYNLHECGARACKVAPYLLQVTDGVANRARHLVGEIFNYLNQLETVKPEFAIEVQKSINLHVDQLISLNATLAYVISQAFHGQIPILASDACLVRQHSLLGIGTAHKAISHLIEFIEHGFEKFPTLLAARKLYSEPLIGTLLADGELQFNRELPQIDSMLASEDFELSEPSLPKMSYFSNRYGFSEGPGIVTVATQSLGGADSVRWSLLTVTHEMMHAHFDVIISELLGDSDELSPLEVFIRSSEPLAVDSEKLESTDFQCPKDAFRSQLIYLASSLQSARLARAELDKTWNPDENLEIKPTTAESAAECLADFVENRKIFEECVVHALDLFYFYQGNMKRYIRALWLSWATVPGVVENLEFYILRSLVCIGYDKSGPILPNRFDAAINLLTQELVGIRDSDGRSASLIIERALEFIRDEKRQDMLKLLFVPLSQIVSSVRHFCFSDNLRLYFETGDPKVISGDAEVVYALETEELSGDRVQNPIAFLSDRLRRNENPDEHYDLTTEIRRSAWVILMLSE